MSIDQQTKSHELLDYGGAGSKASCTDCVSSTVVVCIMACICALHVLCICALHILVEQVSDSDLISNFKVLRSYVLKVIDENGIPNLLEHKVTWCAPFFLVGWLHGMY